MTDEELGLVPTNQLVAALMRRYPAGAIVLARYDKTSKDHGDYSGVVWPDVKTGFELMLGWFDHISEEGQQVKGSKDDVQLFHD